MSEVIVTASRRAENLQKAPSSITVVGGANLQQAGVVQAEDLNKLVPSISLSANGGYTEIFLRGVGTAAGPSGDSSVLVSLDEVALSSPAMVGGNFFDLQRVEVLTGPQGTLYGRNATAGAINIDTNKPTFDGYGGNAFLEIGDYDLVRFEGAVNMPVNDQLAFRAATQQVSRDGYYTDGSGDDREQSYRVEALAKPTDAIKVLVSADYAHLGGRGNPPVPVPFVDPSNPRVGPSTALANSVVPYPFEQVQNNSHDDTDAWGVKVQVDWNLGFGTLTLLPSFRESRVFQILYPGFQTISRARTDETTFEARLASNPGGPLKWLVGAYYFGETDPESDAVDQGLVAQIISRGRNTEAGAVFGDATYSLTHRLRLTAGLRYTEEDRSLAGIVEFLKAPNAEGVPTPIPPGADVLPVSGKVSSGNLSGKGGVDFDLTPTSLLYASIATGFRAGGINPEQVPNTYKPETLTAYSIGSKNRFFGQRLQINVEAYYWDYKNHQETSLLALNGAPGDLSVLTQNVKKSTIKGFSLDGEFAATRDDHFTSHAEYLDATFDNFVYQSPQLASQIAPRTTCVVTPTASPTLPSQVDCSGKPFTRAPKWNATVGYKHTLEMGEYGDLIAGVDAQGATSSYLSTDYIPNSLQKGYIVGDVDLTYKPTHARWSLTGYVRNVSDVTVKDTAFQHPFIPGLVYSTLRPPRTFGVQAAVQF